MKTVCENGKCSACMLCAQICPRQAIRLEETLSNCRAVIDEERCSRCGACSRACPSMIKAERFESRLWTQGWARDEHIRRTGASGGAAAALAQAMLERGGAVCSCRFDGGVFGFHMADTFEEAKKFSGSKYVKSDLRNAFEAIRARLLRGQEVLFIGLPCQCAAVQRYVNDKQDGLIAAELICHGTPSRALLDLYLKQHGKALSSLKDVSFRRKGTFGLSDEKNPLMKFGTRDAYTIAFLESLSYTENCYHCSYAQRKRAADITLGDAWGSDLPAEEMKRGISLILCQTEKGEKLVREAPIQLFSIDSDTAAAHNKQLRAPSVMPSKREKFFRELEQNGNFDRAVLKCCPGAIGKQMLKTVLIAVGVRKPS